MSADYEQLRKTTKRGKQDVLDRYGATNPAEFFAVAKAMAGQAGRGCMIS